MGGIRHKMIALCGSALLWACSSDGSGADGAANGAGGSTVSASGGAGGVVSTGGMSVAPGSGSSGATSFTTGGAGGVIAPASGGNAGAGAAGATSGGLDGAGGLVATGGVTGDGGAASGSGGASSNGGAGGAGSGGAPSTGGVPMGGAPADCPSTPSQTLTVDAASGPFKTLGSALATIPKTNTALVRIDVHAGKYREKLTISANHVCLVGADPMTTTVVYGDANATVASTSGSASVTVSGSDFSATRLTFQNDYGSGSQAVAMRTTGQREQFSNCRFVGYQDTLYVQTGTQYFRNCYVQGNTDYVFGASTAVLESCELRNVEGGSAVAAPNTDPATSIGIVFLQGKFTAVSTVRQGNVALARPWGPKGSATFIGSELGTHVNPAGFVMMSGNDPAAARFGEYASTGPGAAAATHPSYELTAAKAATFTVATVFGSSWTPSYSQ